MQTVAWCRSARRWFVHGLGLGLCACFASCASPKTFVFSSQEAGSSLSLVPLANPEATGESLKNPVTLDMTRLQGRAVRVSGSGKVPQYWFAPEVSSRRVEVRVRQLATCSGEGGNRNRPVRLLLKAYQGLSAEDFTLARELAQQVADIDPTLAAPHIISGLAFLKQRRKEEARLAFNKAKALDPEDTEITELLRMVE